MNVILIRHGRTPGNIEGRYVGSTDESIAEGSSLELLENAAGYPDADLVFSSPLKRCLETASCIYPSLAAEILDDLRELDFGPFEYKSYDELSSLSEYREWIESRGDICPPGMETREEFAERCCKAFAAACQKAKSRGAGTAAFIVHGGTIMAIMERFASPHREYHRWQLGNGDGFACRFNRTEKDEFILDSVRSLPQISTGVEDLFVMKRSQRLQCGYTTGTCAAAASKAASEMLFTGEITRSVDIMTPKGVPVHLKILNQEICGGRASCAVRKFAGDDPDATHGILVYARAEIVNEDSSQGRLGQPSAGSETAAEVAIDGGPGVGRVTKPGLEQNLGEAAINKVPREMIRREVLSICEMQEFRGNIKITVSVPGGEEIARRTFNPHLGIVGGISILGTSGIVMPMSDDAIISSIRLEMKQQHASGHRFLLMTPGNYGEAFLKSRFSDLSDHDICIRCSNFIGDSLDAAIELGIEGILFIAHIGKFIKVSGGIMNTHSAHGDCRAELLAAAALRALSARGADLPEEITHDEITRLQAAERILDSNTTEEAVSMLSGAGLLSPVIDEVIERIQHHLQKRTKGALKTQVVLYSNALGYLGESEGAEDMLREITAESNLKEKRPDMKGKSDANK